MVCLLKQHDFSYEEHVEEKSAIWLKFRYQRDPIGNRITSTTSESGTPVIRNYTSNNLNQYTAIDNPAASPAYDFDGNTVLCPLSSGLWSFTWNAENRMVAAESASTRLEFVYDYMGRRVRKKVFTGSPGAWSLVTDALFVYDEYLQIEELDALNSNSIAKKRIWEPSGNRLLSEIALSPTPYTVYALSDANKNITEYVDASGTVQAHYEYSPFGKITKATGPMSGDFDYQFSSEYSDSETEMIYYNFRYYSPELGRWLSRDPIEEEGGMNLYGMVGNDIINWWDYNGQGLGSYYAKMLGWGFYLVHPRFGKGRGRLLEMTDDGSWAKLSSVGEGKGGLKEIFVKELCNANKTSGDTSTGITIGEGPILAFLVGQVTFNLHWVCSPCEGKKCEFNCNLDWKINDELDLNVDDARLKNRLEDIAIAAIGEAAGIHYYDPKAKQPGSWSIWLNLHPISKIGFQAFPWSVSLKSEEAKVCCQ